MSGISKLIALLQKLTASKSSIHDATKAIAEFTGPVNEAVAAVVQIMKDAGVASKRIQYWYLLDSVAQYGSRKHKTELCAAVLHHLPSVVPLLINPAVGGDSKGEAVLEKVLDVWRRHEVFSVDDLAAALKTIPASSPANTTPLHSETTITISSPPRHPPPQTIVPDRSISTGSVTSGGPPLLPPPLLPTPTLAVDTIPNRLGGTGGPLFIFDLDGVLFHLASLTSGEYGTLNGVSPDTCKLVGTRMEDEIFKLLDDHMFFRDIEPFDARHMHTLELVPYDNMIDLSRYDYSSDGLLRSDGSPDVPKLAYRYRTIRGIYTGATPRRFDAGPNSAIGTLALAANELTRGWMADVIATLTTLRNVNKASIAVVASCQLCEALAKTIAFGFDTLFPIDLVYSCHAQPIGHCISDLMKRFGPSVPVVLVGTQREYQQAADQLRIPFVRVYSITDLKGLPGYADSIMLRGTMPPQGSGHVGLPPGEYHGPGSSGSSERGRRDDDRRYDERDSDRRGGGGLLPPPTIPHDSRETRNASGTSSEVITQRNVEPLPSYDRDHDRRDDSRERGWQEGRRDEPPLNPRPPIRLTHERRSDRDDEPPPPRMKHTLCKFFLNGFCKNGDRCTFAHGTEELRRGGSGGVPDVVRHRDDEYRHPSSSSRDYPSSRPMARGNSGSEYDGYAQQQSTQVHMPQATEQVVVKPSAVGVAVAVPRGLSGVVTTDVTTDDGNAVVRPPKRSRWGGTAPDPDNVTPTPVIPSATGVLQPTASVDTMYNPLEPSSDAMFAAQQLLSSQFGTPVPSPLPVTTQPRTQSYGAALSGAPPPQQFQVPPRGNVNVMPIQPPLPQAVQVQPRPPAKKSGAWSSLAK